MKEKDGPRPRLNRTDNTVVRHAEQTFSHGGMGGGPAQLVAERTLDVIAGTEGEGEGNQA